jgi:hypothetical protein
MTNRYWNTRKDLPMRLMEDEITILKNQGLSFYEIELFEQRRIREVLAREVAFCSKTDNPCINPDGYCSVCGIGEG